jgi:ABC-type glycerol-3-phosphate transport system substrate-binding protein
MRSERSRTAQFAGAIALAASAALAAACGGSNNTTTVTAPTGTLTTDTFNGTLNPPVNGVFQANVNNFNVTTSGGTINITLVTAGPPPTIQLGIALGNPSASGTCSIIPGFSQQAAAGSTAQISASGAPSGAYCVVVGDIGNVLQPVSYTITVAHL